jgi:lipopolysaccharide export system ATP-binding protein
MEPASTTSAIITGLVRTRVKFIWMTGNLPTARIRARLGINYLPRTSVFKLTVGENIMAILETMETDKIRRNERLEELLAELDIAALRPRADSLSEVRRDVGNH